MSTKAINEVLHYAEKLGRVYDQGVLHRARVEVENIERTAKEFVAAPLDPDRRVSLYNMARAIAKDAK